MMRLSSKWALFSAMLCVLALLLLLATKSISAQTTSLGSIAGVVTDPTSAVVPDATVTIRDTATGEIRTAHSNDAGCYIFVNVHPGIYDITIAKPGFSKVSIPRDVVELGQLSTRNVTLPVGANSQTVVVATTGTELQTDNATVGNQISGLALGSLPSIGRDTSTFLALQVGISPDGSVAGAVVDQSSFQLDGGDDCPY